MRSRSLAERRAPDTGSVNLELVDQDFAERASADRKSSTHGSAEPLPDKVTSGFVSPGITYQRQALALVLIFLLSACLFLIVGWFIAREHLHISHQALNRDMAQRIVAENNWLYASGDMLDETAVKNTFDRYMSLNPAIEIYQLDKEGTIIAFSAEKHLVARKKVALEPIHALIENKEPLPVLGDDPRGINRKKIFSATRLSAINPELGYLYVILRGEAVDTVERSIGDSWLARGLIVALLASLSIGLLASLLVFRKLGKPLERLAATAGSNFSKLNLFTPHSVSSRDELQTLESTFSTMSTHIRSQMDQIQYQDQQRRTFIADLSHDLRTPLAIINSILESLQIRFERLSDDERLDHLKTARRQTAHLTGLVDALFQLARLENPSATLEYETINIVDLVQDVAHKHQFSCEAAGITLTARVAGSLPLVSGNTALIERLLDNLIGNAAEHTPAGGHIEIEAYQRSRSIVLSVTDTGCGIAAADRPHIFDAGFRAGNRASGTEGAGLGLAIAERIARLHKGQLELMPSLSGARFEFSLPRNTALR